MENGYNIFDYNININDVVQLMVKPVLSEANKNVPNKADIVKKDPVAAIDKENLQVMRSFSVSVPHILYYIFLNTVIFLEVKLF